MSSAASSATPKKVCCIYDRNSTSNGQWSVLGCELRPEKPASFCHDVVAEPNKWGEWREDIPATSCNASQAQEVCGKGGIDLKLTKKYVGDVRPNVGDEISYELEVTNVTDGDTAVDVTVNDFRNPNLQFVRADGAQCSVLGMSQAVSCDLDNLAPGVSKKFTLVFQLLDRGTSSCTVTNTALVYADNKELMMTDNYANSLVNAYCWGGSSAAASSAASAVPVNSCCMLLYSGMQNCKEVVDENACNQLKGTAQPASPGSPLFYKMQDVHYVSGSQCSAVDCAKFFAMKACCTPTGCVKERVSTCMEAGNKPTTSDSCANMCTSSAFSSVKSSHSSSSSYSSSASPKTDLSIKKELVAIPANQQRNPGDTVTYIITLTNHGEIDATGVTVKDLFPGTLKISAMPSNCTDIPGLITCTDISVPAKGSVDIAIDATVEEPPSICNNTYSIATNRASVSAAPQFDMNASNNIADAYGFDVACPTWEVKKEFLTTGTDAKGQTVKFRLLFKRVGGKYEPNGPGYDNDYFEDVGTYLDFVTLPAGCVVADAGANARKLSCQFPPVAKDATHIVEVTATIKETVCDSGNAGKFSNAVTAKRGKFTSSDKMLGTASVDGTVECTKEEVKYCCSDNKCVEKKSGVTCATDTEYSASPSDCGGACGGTPKYCCTTGNQCGIRGATGVSCKDSTVFNGSSCNGACAPAPKLYCCTADGNRCAQVVGGTACKEESVPGIDSNCGGLCKPVPVKAFCCTAAANSCATEQTLVDGKCAATKAGSSLSGYETRGSCESACYGAWTVSVDLKTEEELAVDDKATFTVTVTRTGAAYDATGGSAVLSLVPDFLSDMTFSDPVCAEGVDEVDACTLPSMSKDATFDVTVTGTVADGACATKIGKINLVASVGSVSDSAPSDVMCESGKAGCCVRDISTGEGMTCNYNLTEDDCDDIEGQTWYAESCFSQCGMVRMNACADGCFPALANGSCPVDPYEIVRVPPSPWSRFVGWLTGSSSPLAAELINVGSGCCCPSDGDTGGTATGGADGGEAGGDAGGTGGASSAASSEPTEKQCGACSGNSQTACENGPSACRWKGSAFGFVTVLFGGSSGTCSPEPRCLSGGTSSASEAASSAASNGGSSSSESSEDPVEYIWYVIGLAPFDAPACSDGEDNDGDRRVDRDDPGCYDPLMAVDSPLSRLAAAVGLTLKPWGTYLPERDSELCDPGMFEAEGKCVALPQCPARVGEVQQDRVNALLKCGTGCQGNSRCTGICACNCTASPDDAADAVEDVQVCFNRCLARTSHPECVPVADGKTPQGLSQAECCRARCVTERCGM